MYQWSVTTKNAEVFIDAHKVSVSPCGALLFLDADGIITRAYANGHWVDFHLTQLGRHGYR